MNNKYLDDLEELLDTGDCTEALYSLFDKPDFFIQDFYNTLIEKRSGHLEALPDSYFKNMCVNKMNFIAEESALVKCLIYPFVIIKHPGMLNEGQKVEMNRAVENGVARLRYAFDEYETILDYNYNTKELNSVENLLFHLRGLFRFLNESLFRDTVRFESTPYYKALSLWMEQMGEKYHHKKLIRKLQQNKQGLHELHEVFIESFTFEDLFSDKRTAAIIKRHWKDSKLVDKKYRLLPPHKPTTIVRVIKYLRDKKKKLRRDISLNNYHIQYAVKNSFNVHVPYRTVAWSGASEADSEFLPDLK
jgi:hypothetical protein